MNILLAIRPEGRASVLSRRDPGAARPSARHGRRGAPGGAEEGDRGGHRRDGGGEGAGPVRRGQGPATQGPRTAAVHCRSSQRTRIAAVAWRAVLSVRCSLLTKPRDHLFFFESYDAYQILGSGGTHRTLNYDMTLNRSRGQGAPPGRNIFF